jgi:micrococcal nuclease
MTAFIQILRSLASLYLYLLRFCAANLRLRMPVKVKLVSAVGGVGLLVAPCIVSVYLFQFTRSLFVRSTPPRSLAAPPVSSPLPFRATPKPSAPLLVTPSSRSTPTVLSTGSALGDGSRVPARVIGTTDGDTIEVQLGSTVERVHLLGADTPEPGMCFGDKAAARTRALVANQTVTLESDPTQTNRDKYGRLNRYIWLANEQLLNAVLIQEGLAFEYTYFIPYTHQAQFQQLEATARAQQLGVWSAATCNGAGRRPDRRPQASTTLAMPAALTPARVTRVIDGDTIEVDINGQNERVRFIGIDTPEVGRCYAQQATDRLTQLLTGSQVLLEADASQDDRDKFGRLLRYIWLPDSQQANYLLVQEGYAYEYTYRVAYRYEPQFMQVENEAHRGGLGLWSPTTCDARAGRRYSPAYNTN